MRGASNQQIADCLGFNEKIDQARKAATMFQKVNVPLLAMPPAEYQAWLTGGRTTGSIAIMRRSGAASWARP